jgi:hypothetical protein
MVEVG